MEQIIFRPRIYAYDTCDAFLKDFTIRKSDLVLSNAYIYEPYFNKYELPCTVLYQENYGFGEPTDEMAAAILKDVPQDCSRVIAIGGGSILDLAKVISVADSDDIDDLYRRMPDLSRQKELILIPTTCGTGSEVTNIAVLNRLRLGTKMGLVSEAMFADKAVLIPELLESLPFKVFATSSIDALVHAVESALSPKATPFTKTFSYQAMDMILKDYQLMEKEGPEKRKELMKDFLTASSFAGLAFGTAGTGTVHAMAYPLGGQYHVAHGESNYALFTGVLKEYREEVSQEGEREDRELTILIDHLSSVLGCDPANVFDSLERLLDHILPKKALREYGVKEEELKEFASSVIANQQRLLRNSYLPMNEEKVLKIYQSLY